MGGGGAAVPPSGRCLPAACLPDPACMLYAAGLFLPVIVNDGWLRKEKWVRLDNIVS